jgi:hypothetical protein
MRRQLNTALTILFRPLTNAEHSARHIKHVHLPHVLFASPNGGRRVGAVNMFPMQKIPSFLLALSLGAAAAVSAQTTSTPTDGSRGPRSGPGGHGRGGHGHPIVRALDTDKNHELSTQELANAAASIRTLDANSDGIISPEELRPVRPAGAPTPPGTTQRPAGAPARKGDATPRGDGTAHAHPIDPVMLALDANADGSLSIAETANATASLTALDANKDGKLTPDELRPLPPTR